MANRKVKSSTRGLHVLGSPTERARISNNTSIKSFCILFLAILLRSSISEFYWISFDTF